MYLPRGRFYGYWHYTCCSSYKTIDLISVAGKSMVLRVNLDNNIFIGREMYYTPYLAVRVLHFSSSHGFHLLGYK